jgi:hypothetical protein
MAATPPWLAEEFTTPLMQSYEARIRELESANAQHVEANAMLRKEYDVLAAVSAGVVLAFTPPLMC